MAVGMWVVVAMVMVMIVVVLRIVVMIVCMVLRMNLYHRVSRRVSMVMWMIVNTVVIMAMRYGVVVVMPAHAVFDAKLTVFTTITRHQRLWFTTF